MITASALKKFVNVDGELGHKVMPFPHDPEYNPEVLRFDKMTAADRISEIESDLSPLEYAALTGFILLCSGATLATMSFYEFLHWQVLSSTSHRSKLV
jgi:hypothetical protein